MTWKLPQKRYLIGNVLKVKSIKDNIHGYIELDEKYWKVIDTPEFQRLKWIEQTSYRVLYPSARHDRFVHSIGTFQLGKMALVGFKKNACLILKCKKFIDDNSCSFLLACLLHDIGHSPLSHTCEDLFNYNNKISDINSRINKKLLQLVSISNDLTNEEKDDFLKDYHYILNCKDKICKPPSEHEVMSSIIVIKNYNKFSECFSKEERIYLKLDLIIRAIMGCVYGVNSSEKNEKKIEKGIKNCLIRLLNSTSVDVDKLDYITRDTMMTGYENLTLDTKRLLGSLSIIKRGEFYFPAFKKSAISVISNVVTAKNAQARWIINHPSVQYESFLVRQSIGIAIKNYYEKHQLINEYPNIDSLIEQLFSEKSISREGIEFGGMRLNFLSDIEIMFLLKQSINDPIVSELYERNDRRKPIWKSFDEFKYYLPEKEKQELFADCFAPLITAVKRIENLSKPKQIDSNFYNLIKHNPEDYANSEDLIHILDLLDEFRASKSISFDFVIIPIKNTFSTSLNDNTYIQFEDNIESWVSYKNPVQNNITEQYSYEFFYLYSKDRINAKEFISYILQKLIEGQTVRC